MRIAYLDCFSGISGDMMLGALLDLGLDEDRLREGLSALPLSGYRVEVSRESRQGMAGTRVQVIVDEASQPHRHYRDIRSLIDQSPLPDAIRELAGDIFQRVARAEATVHGVPEERVHFHEVGAVDSIVDIVGAALGLHALGIRRCYVSSLPLGGGFVRCAHGVLPVPAPATLEILKGMRVRDLAVEAELVTPTGAAIAAALAGPGHPAPPPMRVLGTGYGAGKRDLPHPNLLRVVLAEGAAGYEEDDVQVIETQMDDLQPEVYGHLMERLLQSGALDVYLVPVQMKKGRPGVLVRVIADPADTLRISELLFRETTTLGVRLSRSRRVKLQRRAGTVSTVFGPVQVKIVEGPCLEGPEVRPEYEACRRVAEANRVPLRAVYEEVYRAAGSAGCRDAPATDGQQRGEPPPDG